MSAPLEVSKFRLVITVFSLYCWAVLHAYLMKFSLSLLFGSKRLFEGHHRLFSTRLVHRFELKFELVHQHPLLLIGGILYLLEQ